MTYILYDLLLWLAAPFIVLYHFYRSVSRGRPASFGSRFGFISGEPEKGTHGPIWVHAVSVGETIAAKSLISSLKQRYPDRKIIVSNVTETGREIAEKLPDVDHCLYFPFDYSFAVRRILERVRPSVIIIVETEIWPNFVRTARKLNIPVVMVNGRISDRSFGRYLKLRWFFRPVLANFTCFCMQSEEDARRITAIGAEAAKVQVTRNLKYDIPLHVLSDEERDAVRSVYRVDARQLVFTAGSTHLGEDEAVIGAFRKISSEVGNAVLVLVPRHPERAGAVAGILSSFGVPFTLRSQIDSRQQLIRSGEALLVDTVGELMRLYSVSDIVFVGGSLAPTGGHNVLEPASCGVPVLFGPHMSNFREISAAMLQSGAGIQVEDGGVLYEQLLSLCKDPARRRTMGDYGMNWLRNNGGSVLRHVEVIEQVLGVK